MRGLILFRSHYGNTKRVAESIAQEITALGHEAVIYDVCQKLPDLESFDFVMIGSPTRFARADGKALSALKQLRKKGFTKKPVAVFDTYGPVPTEPKELEKAENGFTPALRARC
jgi:menaquinone-dependent protoporphyrinogen IX oxidase